MVPMTFPSPFSVTTFTLSSKIYYGPVFPSLFNTINYTPISIVVYFFLFYTRSWFKYIPFLSNSRFDSPSLMFHFN